MHSPHRYLLPALVASVALLVVAWAIPATMRERPTELDQVATILTAADRANAQAGRQIHRAQALVDRLRAAEDYEPIRPPSIRPPPAGSWDPETFCDDLRALVRDIDRTDWDVVVPPYPDFSDAYSPNREPADQTWERVVYRGGYRLAVGTYGNHPTDTPPVGHVRDWFVLEPMAAAPGEWIRSSGQDIYGKMIWGSRVYNQIGGRWLHGWIHDVPKEHGIYESPAGAVEYGWIWFEELGAQALQVSWREAEQNPYRAGDLVWMHDLCVHNCGHGRFGASGGGPSFPLTIAFQDGGPGHEADVTIERFHVYTVHEDGLPAKGAILVGASSADHWTYGDVRIGPGLVELAGNDRAVIKAEGARSMVISGITFDIDGNQTVELDPTPSEIASGRIEWTDNLGAEELAIRVRGEFVGWGNETIIIEDGRRIR